jgi:hypothetical protein
LTKSTAFLLLAGRPFFMVVGQASSRSSFLNKPQHDRQDACPTAFERGLADPGAKKNGGDAHCAAASLSGIKPPVLDH